jgi:hypothetical protein
MLKLITVFAGILVVTTGCTNTVHPLLTDEDLISDVDLTGRWEVVQSKDGDQAPSVIECTADKKHKLYDVSFENFRKPGSDDDAYVMKVGRIADKTYVQLTRLEMPADGPPLLDTVPIYTIARIEVHGDKVNLFPIDEQKRTELIKSEKLPHVEYLMSDLGKPFVVFTMTTAELQQLVQKHGDTLFQVKPVVLSRIEK